MSLARAQLDAIVHALTIILPAREPADASLRYAPVAKSTFGPESRRPIVQG